jgi:hypothetical protein
VGWAGGKTIDNQKPKKVCKTAMKIEFKLTVAQGRKAVEAKRHREERSPLSWW